MRFKENSLPDGGGGNSALSDECDIGFRVQFNAEFPPSGNEFSYRTARDLNSSYALFWVTSKFYCIASAHESATTARQCYYIHFEIAPIQDLVDSNTLLTQYRAGWLMNKQNRNAFISTYTVEECTTLNKKGNCRVIDLQNRLKRSKID